MAEYLQKSPDVYEAIQLVDGSPQSVDAVTAWAVQWGFGVTWRYNLATHLPYVEITSNMARGRQSCTVLVGQWVVKHPDGSIATMDHEGPDGFDATFAVTPSEEPL